MEANKKHEMEYSILELRWGTTHNDPAVRNHNAGKSS